MMEIHKTLSFFLGMLDTSLPDYFHSINFQLKEQNNLSIMIASTHSKTKQTTHTITPITQQVIQIGIMPDAVSFHLQADRHIKKIMDAAGGATTEHEPTVPRRSDIPGCPACELIRGISYCSLERESDECLVVVEEIIKK